ncbi:hypothetical protein Pint_23454 [Pistacia integerrima]|uniref:Uncharacterized protein n=1 Tax=Pistacia integerrima TaxID=434235 RepID=A0ACC0YKV6_9ROSI|nr:hypothetical protein Pint_23454 [Pistacia integerrima]
MITEAVSYGSDFLGLLVKAYKDSDMTKKLTIDEILMSMSMIINESLRLYSPFVSLNRKIDREVILGKLTVPATVNICIPTLALHNNTQIWGEDAHLFKPGSFAEGVAKATNKNPVAFLPFGLGRRTCVGMNFCDYRNKDCTLNDSAAIQNHSVTNLC